MNTSKVFLAFLLLAVFSTGSFRNVLAVTLPSDLRTGKTGSASGEEEIENKLRGVEGQLRSIALEMGRKSDKREEMVKDLEKRVRLVESARSSENRKPVPPECEIGRIGWALDQCQGGGQ